jgi:hypothetical protein
VKGAEKSVPMLAACMLSQGGKQNDADCIHGNLDCLISEIVLNTFSLEMESVTAFLPRNACGTVERMVPRLILPLISPMK